MALDEVSGATGSSRVTLKKLDDSTPLAGQWDPGKVSANARKAANDQSTVGYIGEFNSGASAISTPILNQSGVMEISPSNTYLGLTKRIRPGALGEPDKYYPPGKRTFARVAPADHIQAGALAEWMKELGVRRLYVVDDRNGCGEEVASVTAAAARLNGIKVVGRTGMDTRARSYRAIARRVRRSRADGFFFGGVTPSNAPRLYRDVWTRNRKLQLFGGDGLAEGRFTRHVPKGAQRRMHITVGTYDPADLPPRGQDFVRRFHERFGRDPEPYAIYGYEAMALLLDAIQRAGPRCGDRAEVVRQVFATSNRDSVLGVYSLDADGDVTTSRFGRYLVKGGRLVYDRATIVKRDAYGNALT
jgi:branched-chain amino acid transport system substrate-binding protein